ncbi:MAG: hypothetical protein B7733_25385 [Myxococcales bacterium FL481]|nr:MAG: hypothetical protein B7733_25385 [Myxococcales bacterium FL481]
MSIPRLGVVIDDDTRLMAHHGLPVAVLALRSTWLNPPRAKGASSLANRLDERYPSAVRAIYAWHYVTHGPQDRAAAQASRSLGSAVAPQTWGHLQASPVVEEAWQTTKTCAEQLGASTIVLSTPPSFTPSALNRARLREFVESQRNRVDALVWDVRGLWSAGDAMVTARSLDIGVMLPASESREALTGDPDGRLWLRIEHGRREADQLFENLASAEATHDALTVLFTGARAETDLRQFHARCEREL